ncbi:MAG: 2-oxo-4-hydroxy-4-carboxy-5-ureidoimidazoline decarboxylase [Galactobacter sp.]
MRLSDFNGLDSTAARDHLRPAVDVDRWLDALVADRSYASVEALYTAGATQPAFTAAEMDAALAHHPRIGERAAGDGAEAQHSRQEQAGVSTDAGLAGELAEANAAYEQRFGRVFLIRAKGRSGEEILSHLRRRLDNDEASEAEETAQQLLQIAGLRLESLVTPDAKHRSAVTTHVLDTGTGRPASGVSVSLEAWDGSSWRVLGTGVTDADGRIESLGPDEAEPGRHRVTYDTGTWFGQKGTETSFPAVVIEFQIADPNQHYHVPLLLSPFAYSTYRGS